MSQLLIAAGRSACFQRPEFIHDQITYDGITPMAARGIFEAIHWTPSIRWDVERIHVLNRIETCWVDPSTTHMENEGASRSLQLADVRYLLQARFELTERAGPAENAGQHAQMFRRRAKSQRFFRTPYFGQREHEAEVRLVEKGGEPVSAYAGQGTIDLGWMLHDRDATPERHPRYFRAMMVDGVIDLRSLDVASLPR